MKIGIIDNYDSFTFNLVQLFGEHVGIEAVQVWRHDAIDIEGVEAAKISHLVISPGPGRPADAGISTSVIRHFAGRLPILGVCLGHQCMAEAFGGRVVQSPRLMHGKTSLIWHDGQGIFEGLPNPFTAARYHSLIIDRAGLPADFSVTAWTDRGEIMAVAHRHWPMIGVQFHPESFMTEGGRQLVDNFLAVLPATVTRAPCALSTYAPVPDGHDAIQLGH